MWGERAEKTVQRSKIAVLSISLLCHYNFSELKERTNKGSAVCQEQENALTCYLHSGARISVGKQQGKQQILQDNKLQISYLKQIRSIYYWNAGVFISASISASISQNLYVLSHIVKQLSWWFSSEMPWKGEKRTKYGLAFFYRHYIL